MQFQEIFAKAYTNKVGSYKIERLIAQGSSGDVYLGQFENTPVAIKVLRKVHLDPEDVKEQESNILKEIEISKKFNHENIIKFVTFEKKPWYNLVFEYCENGDLQTFLDKNFPGSPIPEHQAFKLICQIVSGFRELWSKNVVHRDFKPGNILLASNYTAKIADFGASKVSAPNNQVFQTLVGTYFTMAPEVLDGLTHDAKCDVWSLGVVFYRILTGKEPYNTNSVFSHIVRDRINHMQLGDFSGDTWCFLRELITSMLIIDPAHRISPEQLFERLEKAKKELYEGKYAEYFNKEDPIRSKNWYPITTPEFEQFYYLKVHYLNNWISFEFEREMDGKFISDKELVMSQADEKGPATKESSISNSDGHSEEESKVSITFEKGTHTWSDGVIYSGSLVENRREGYGELTFPNKSNYKGHWKNNKFHGEGILSLCDGRVYKGKWSHGRPIEGELTLANGNKYEGKWALSLMHDENGKYSFAKGTVYIVYQGSFVEGMMQEFGEIQYPTGEKYVGFWKNNNICGNGEIIWHEGKVFKGKFTPKTATNHNEFKGIFLSEDGVEYRADWRDMRINDLHAVIVWRNGKKYEGTVIRGEIEGKGRMKYPNGEVYSGEWKNGEFHGLGTYFYCDGRKFTGQFVNGKANGMGKMEFGDGNIYIGGWQNGVAHGEGECTLQDGKVLKVKFNNGNQEGLPIILGTKAGCQEIFFANSVYRGQTKNGKKHGKGKWVFIDGQVIVGDFVDNLIEGYGEFTNPSGTYRGMWMKNLSHGEGEYIWPDGSKYVGSFFEGSRKGYGEMQYASGELYKGQWENSQRHGQGELVYPDGTKYSGAWMNDEKHGEGILLKTNGEMLIGTWALNKARNHGNIIYPDGKNYHGEIDVDEFLPNGVGTMIYPDGHQVKGAWKKGELISNEEESQKCE